MTDEECELYEMPKSMCAHCRGIKEEPLEKERPRTKCKYCDSDEVMWVELPNGWRMFDLDGDQHYC